MTEPPIFRPAVLFYGNQNKRNILTSLALVITTIVASLAYNRKPPGAVVPLPPEAPPLGRYDRDAPSLLDSFMRW